MYFDKISDGKKNYHQQGMCAEYSQTIMNESVVNQWFYMFKNGFHDELVINSFRKFMNRLVKIGGSQSLKILSDNHKTQ